MAERDDTMDQPRLTDADVDEQGPPPGCGEELASILDRYMADLQAGNTPDRQRLLEDHPELAAELARCLAGIEFIHQATGSPAQEPTVLGEFRIIRELGRGGMGVVYEAEQTSLRRHVALKVLRFGVVADLEAMQRFRREAETLARLHHTNIVPIFAVGCERGVHYYAMQFIEGRSLADVLTESQRMGKPLPVEGIVRWGLQAAEALAHAHQRGVIHRDIKPSNLLFDHDGVVWLTDFGLAKRADLATLTVHGTLMGTPRYMSPEQAASLQQPVDRRTDLYSLGASLYELATGRPVFESASSHLVIAQILTDEPVRPRQIRPSLPRDLETIILTCLAKEPAQRYQSAQALASDLRAVLESRPIQARRAPLIERAVRFVRQRRKTLRGAGLATVVTVLLLLGALGAWRYYSEWRLGRIVLTTDGPALTAKVIPETGLDPIGEPFSIGAHSMLALPAGDYRLRVQGPGLLGQTFRVAFNRGETRTHKVTLGDNRLMGTESIPYWAVSEALTLTPGKADFIEWTGLSLIRRDGSTGKPVWNAAQPASPWDPKRDPVDWLRRLSKFGSRVQPGVIVQPAPDLNGDGTGDLVWAIDGTPSLLALSGNDGSFLWAYSVDLDGPVPSRSAEAVPPAGRIMGEPVAADVDGDGTMDLIAEFAIFDFRKGLVTQSAQPTGSGTAAEAVLTGRRVAAAVSGRSGKELWHELIDRQPTDFPRQIFDHGITYVSQPNGPFVALVDGSKWIALDPATGRPQGRPIELGFAPVLPIQHADFDGDGAMEILALEAGKGNEPLTGPTLEAFSSATGKRLWTKRLMAYYRPMPAVPVRDWPLAADLDGDGRIEVVIPHVDALLPRTGAVYGGVRMLDGVTGATRWDCPLWPGMKSGSDGLVHLLAGPDLDADGTSDLAVVSRFDGQHPNEAFVGQLPEPSRVYVDAVSGKDGHHLWHWRTELENADTTPIRPVFWWGRGSDGWPMLAVPIGGGAGPGVASDNRFYRPDPSVVHLLAAATGTEVHTLPGLAWPKCADLDGDGLVDLWGSFDAKLCAIRGDPPEAWRALDRLQPAGDFDGDGVTDVLSNDFEPPRIGPGPRTESRTALARSGRDGRILWRTRLDPWEDWFSWAWVERTTAYGFDPLRLRGGDLNGDGVPEVLVRRGANRISMYHRGPAALPLTALSGRDGRPLWSAGLLPPFDSTRLGEPYIDGIDGCACEPRGLPDVLAAYDLAFENALIPRSVFDQELRLARLRGRDGRVIWDVLLATYKGGITKRSGFVHEIADLDGDGGLEIVLLLRGNSNMGPRPDELRVLSLATGATRWLHQLSRVGPMFPAFAVGDLDGDGRQEVIVSELQIGTAIEVDVLDGRDGTIRWTWRGGEARGSSDQNAPLRLAGFDGGRRKDICVNFGIAEGRRRVVILDAQGQTRGSRELAPASLPMLVSADLDGDGRDELLFHDGDRLRAAEGDLVERWSWPTRELIREVVSGSSGRPATVVLNPSLGLDGATGRPIWSIGSGGSLLRSSDGKSLPRALAGPEGTTVCRVAMPVSADGRYQPAHGILAKAAALGDDPRWERPLPWIRPVEPHADPLVQVAMAATLINVCVPLAILWLATRRRIWSVRLLLALPAVVAILLTGYSFLISLIPDRPQPTEPPWWGVPLGVAMFSMSGLPIVAFVAALGLALVRRRWWRIGLLVAGDLLAAILLAAVLLQYDRLQMTAMEHYNWSGWHHALFLGAYAVGALVLLARPARWVVRFAFRPVRRHLRFGSRSS